MALGNKICICGSMTFIDDIESLAMALRAVGYDVQTPDREGAALNWTDLDEEARFARKREFIDAHLALIKDADLVLIANYSKNGVEGYIGANSLMEAAFAYAIGVPVAYLNDVGEQACRLEALSISAGIVAPDPRSIDSLLQSTVREAR